MQPSVPQTAEPFLELLRKSGLAEEPRLRDFLAENPPSSLPSQSTEIARLLVEKKLLTQFQADLLLKGKFRGFIISGKYRLLDILGVGGMGRVFLCEHIRMRRRVALKMLPDEQLKDPSALERFEREARAVAALKHPNIVQAHDIDQDGKMHFLVMEYVEGVSFSQLVRSQGPLDPLRAASYIVQAALGLQHAHEAGLVHRDIKPGNLLLDRTGVVKILDMGLARFFLDKTDELTKQYDERSVLGTADYLSPEQALNSHDVDIRSDIYSLGATFYFMLTGRTPFGEGSVAQKLLWHQMREPTSVREIRPEIPEGIELILRKMMAKNPNHRFSLPIEVAQVLEPWARAANLPMGPAMSGSFAVPPSGPLMSTTINTPITASGFLPAVALPSGTGSSAKHPASVIMATPFQNTPIPGSEKTLRAVPLPAEAQAGKTGDKKKLLIGVAAAAALLVGVGLWLGLGQSKKATPILPHQPTTHAARKLVVGDREPDSYPTINAALEAAQDGDTILLKADLWKEAVSVSSKNVRAKNIRIVGEAPSGAPVIWRAPKDHPAQTPLLSIGNITGVTIHQIVFDGEGKVDRLIRVFGNCNSCILKDIECRGYRLEAIRLEECMGGEPPLTISRCHIRATQANSTGIHLVSADDKYCTQILLEHLRIDGLGTATGTGIEFDCEVRDLLIRKSRFHNLRAGILYRQQDNRLWPISFALIDSTFFKTDHGISMEAVPPNNPRGPILIENNLFLATRTPLAIGPRLANSALQFPNGVWLNGCDEMPRSTSGLDLKQVPTETVQTTRPEDNKTFMRYPLSSPLCTAGTKNQPIGAGTFE